MQIKKSHSSKGRLNNFNPLMYWGLNPQIPLFVKIISQEIKNAIIMKMAGNSDVHFL